MNESQSRAPKHANTNSEQAAARHASVECRAVAGSSEQPTLASTQTQAPSTLPATQQPSLINLPSAQAQPAPQLSPAEQHALLQRILDIQTELISVSFEKAQAYANLIMGAAYAGFFATWAFTRDQLSRQQVLWSALLMLISLVAFVLFEVYKMVHNTRSQTELFKIVADGSTFLERLADFKKRWHKKQVTMGHVWVCALSITLVFGLTAAGILVWGFVAGLLHVYFAG